MATRAHVIVVLFQLSCLGCVAGIHWTFTPDTHMHACAGSKVVFPWDFELEENETIVNVEWLHQGPSDAKSVVVGTMVREHFVAMNDFVGRVERQKSNSGGLVLEDVKVEDSGNYTLDIRASKGSVIRKLESTVDLQVADDLMLKGGRLIAGQDADAFWDASTRQWFIRLTCGPFAFRAQPAADVSWTKPGGQKVNSSGYEDGNFFLSLVTPVKGGQYTCVIPPASLPQLCARQDGGRHVDFTARVTVDERSAKLSLLEANHMTLLEDGTRLRERLRTLRDVHSHYMTNITQQCRSMMSEVQDQIERVNRERDSAKSKLEEWFKLAGIDFNNHNNSNDNDDDDDANPDGSGMVSDDEDDGAISREGACASREHTVKEEPWRSVEKVGGGSSLQCDKTMEEGWYRFTLHGQNAKMPTKCVPTNKCSTHAPMWLDLQGNGFPEVGEQVRVRACAHWSGNCCNWETPVTVRNCGDYIVYRLQPFDDCHLAYCMELHNV